MKYDVWLNDRLIYEWLKYLKFTVLHFLVTDAMNCLQQQHIIDKKILNVQKYDPNDPSLWEMDKALVTGLNPVTTEDTLMNFLEPAAGVELEDLVRGAQEDVAIVVFAEKPGM